MQRRIVVVFVMTALLGVAGCQTLTREQVAHLDALEAQMTQVAGIITDYEGKVADIIADIRAKRVPIQSGMAMIEQVLRDKERNIDLYKKIAAERKALADTGTPPWAIALSLVGTVAGIALGYYPASRKLRVAQAVSRAIIKGVERGEKRYTAVVTDLLDRIPEDERAKLDPDKPLTKLVKGSIQYESGEAGIKDDVRDAKVEAVG